MEGKKRIPFTEIILKTKEDHVCTHCGEVILKGSRATMKTDLNFDGRKGIMHQDGECPTGASSIRDMALSVRFQIAMPCPDSRLHCTANPLLKDGQVPVCPSCGYNGYNGKKGNTKGVVVRQASIAEVEEALAITMNRLALKGLDLDENLRIITKGDEAFDDAECLQFMSSQKA